MKTNFLDTSVNNFLIILTLTSIFSPFSSHATVNCATALSTECFAYSEGYNYSWPSNGYMPPMETSIGGGIGGGGGVYGNSIFNHLNSESFQQCQSVWANWANDDCNEQYSQIIEDYTDVCTTVAATLGIGSTTAAVAATYGCIGAKAYAQNSIDEECSDMAVDGILENCL